MSQEKTITADRKDDDAKGHRVNIKRNTDSIGNPDTMFE